MSQKKKKGKKNMKETKESIFLSDTDVSITRLLSGLNFETFQKQQEFLRNIEIHDESQEAIVTGILNLMDRVAGFYEETTGHSLVNRFDAVESYSKLLSTLDYATNKGYSLSELLNSTSSDDAFGYAHIRFGNIICTIAVLCGGLFSIGSVYVLKGKSKIVLERLSKEVFDELLKEANPLTLEEMEAAKLCAGGNFYDLR